jgi:hypothetical protein
MPGSPVPRPWRISVLCLFLLAVSRAVAQDVSVVRSPQASDMTVRLENLASHLTYERNGDSYFIVPTGRYSIQLLRQGRVVYQEAEFLGPDAPNPRTVGPSGDAIVVGLPEGNPQFDANPCAALENASRLAVGRFGLRDSDVQQRLANADFTGKASGCAASGVADALASILAGAYGVTPLGMVNVSIDFLPLSPSGRAHRTPHPSGGADASHPNAWMNKLTGLGLVGDLKQGFSAVAVGSGDTAFLVCAALNGDAPLFCNSDGQVVGPAEVGSFRGIYRLRVKTTPVDYRGVEDDHWTTFVGEEEYRRTQETLTAALETIQANLTQRIAQVESGTSSAPDDRFPGQTMKSYATDQLVSLIETTQSEVDAALRDEKLQPLRRHFPTTLARLDASSQPFVPAQDALRIYRELKDTVTLLSKSSGDLGVDLVFRTAPVETEGARLTFDACARCAPVVSQGGQHRFFRGRYHVTASLDGYVPYEGWLDLVDDPKSILECDLVRVHSRTNSRTSSCTLRTQ